MNIFKRNFFILTLGMIVSQIGTYFFDFAVSWYILDKTKSATYTTIYLVIGLTIRVIMGPVIATFIERKNRKKLLVNLDLLNGIYMIFLYALLSVVDNMRIIYILLLISSVVISLVSSAYNPIFSHLFKNILDKKQLVKGNAKVEENHLYNKCKGRPREWSKIMEQLFIYFENRISTDDLY